VLNSDPLFLMVKGTFVFFYICEEVRSTQFLEVCQKMYLLSLINVCMCVVCVIIVSVWGINFQVFEVDGLQEQENRKSRCSFLNMDVLPDKCVSVHVLCVFGCVGINFSVLRLIVFKLW